MQREGMLHSEAERKLTEEMANKIGTALEDISRATGSVAHFYKSLQIGNSGSEARVQARANEPSFQGLIDEVASVRNANQPGAGVQ